MAKKKKSKKSTTDTGWVYQTQVLRCVIVDEVKYSVAISQHPDDRKFVAVGLRTAGNSVEEVFDDHAHKVIGRYKTDMSARKAGERWLEKTLELKLCECGEI
jgi:hypothetical protein